VIIGDFLKLISGSFAGELTTPALTADRIYTFPDKNGTVAMLTDISNGGSYSEVVNESSSFNIVGSDGGKFLRCINTNTITITVLNDAAFDFPIGTEIEITQDSTGQVNINSGSGCAIRTEGTSQTSNFRLLGQYSVATLKKVAANEWRLYGGVTW